MNSAKCHTEVWLIKSNRNIFIDAITNVSKHKFLESNGLEFYFLFNFFLRCLKWKLFRASMVKKIRKHKFNFEHHLSLVKVSCFLAILMKALRLGVRALVGVYLHSKVANIIQLYFLLAISYHESSCIEFQIFFIDGCWKNVVMIQVFPFSLFWIIFLTWSSPYNLVGAIRKFGVEYGVRLCVVEFLALLIVKAAPKEINTLVIQIDISEWFEMNDHFCHWSKRHLSNN